ncbi:hypothetical protein GQ600_24640 [Phytophthora cactorum]|nr:hypothetical protein GQ600_24640 [Phytophthora cactorum]
MIQLHDSMNSNKNVMRLKAITTEIGSALQDTYELMNLCRRMATAAAFWCVYTCRSACPARRQVMSPLLYHEVTLGGAARYSGSEMSLVGAA